MAETALPKRADVAQGDFFVLFADRIAPDLNSGCHLWAGSRSRAGYGTLTWKGHTRLTHRCAYEAENGIGSALGLVVRHKCDTPACVNPHHLIGGTTRDNVADMFARGRQNPPRGERSSKCKLSEVQVIEIRALAADGWPISRLARKYPIGHNAMEALVRGRSWKHISGAVPFPAKAKIPGAKPGQGAWVLNESDVREIKSRLLRGEKNVRLAEEFGCASVTISAIKVGRIWGHVHAD